MTIFVHEIITAVAQEFGVSKLDILSRRRSFALPRQAVMFLAVALTEHSFQTIGDVLKRNPTTVKSGLDTICIKAAQNTDLEQRLIKLRTQLEQADNPTGGVP